MGETKSLRDHLADTRPGFHVRMAIYYCYRDGDTEHVHDYPEDQVPLVLEKALERGDGNIYRALEIIKNEFTAMRRRQEA